MYWPVVLVVIKATMTPGGLSYNTHQNKGYDTKVACEETLSEALTAAQMLPWPMHNSELMFVPGCIDMHPEDFFRQHIQSSKPDVKA